MSPSGPYCWSCGCIVEWCTCPTLAVIETEGQDREAGLGAKPESAISANLLSKEKRPEVRLNTPERYSDSALMM